MSLRDSLIFDEEEEAAPMLHRLVVARCFDFTAIANK
jgi:hypothetical protein